MKTKSTLTRSTRRLRPSPALLVAFLALFVAMSGIGYAAVKLKANAVKTRNIAANAVTTPKIADGAVTRSKIGPGAVSPTDTTGLTRVVATGLIADPGLLNAGKCSDVISKSVPGVRAGDTILITYDNTVNTPDTSATGTVTDGAVHYVGCNLSGANANYGTVEETKFMVLRGN
jgi:hypothetical protein